MSPCIKEWVKVFFPIEPFQTQDQFLSWTKSGQEDSTWKRLHRLGLMCKIKLLTSFWSQIRQQKRSSKLKIINLLPHFATMKSRKLHKKGEYKSQLSYYDIWEWEVDDLRRIIKGNRYCDGRIRLSLTSQSRYSSSNGDSSKMFASFFVLALLLLFVQ